ncbi:urease accessory protein UreF [Psychrobacter sp. SWN149]|uniref:urease accessory protein UreF n=1 Tax=Psychrobacter sp. SWN149 TaxID=2792057 RepID=UPI0018CD936D|nr:urease accessory UreF family protein [Psychrobacter sp. SWN149]MBH0007614.1 urease accessory protein UreF [Psychrobacter sp. SWN149]
MVDTNAQSAQPDQLGQLLMLASSNLPIGSYTYSQGVESAIESGVISDEASTLVFMQDYLALAVIGYELPILGLIMLALGQGNDVLAANLAHDYHASLESKEFVLESQQLAQAMVSWLNEVLSLGIPAEIPEDGYLPLFAHIAQHWQLPLAQSMTTYGFAQLENMVLAAVKTVPLGQMAGQRILWQLQSDLGAQIDAVSTNIQHTFDTLMTSPDSLKEQDCQQLCQDLYEILNISNNLPNLAILSSMHEEQYSRLFRS